MSNDVEDMEVDAQESSDNHQQASGTSSHEEEGFLITVSVKWSESDGPSKKPTTELQFALQSWLNNSIKGKSCDVLSQSDDGSFIVKIEPSTWSEFQKLNGQTLTRKDKDKAVKIMSIKATSPKQEPQTSEAASMNLHPSSTLQKDDEGMNDIKQSGSSVTAADSAAEELTCLPVPYFWYMSHVYKEQLQHIEEATGVKITAEVKVTFGSSGDQQKALSEFTELKQKFLHEFSFKAVPIKDVHSEVWSNTKKIIQKSDNKVLVTVSSEEMVICGPSKSQEAIMESMNATQNLNRSVEVSAGADEDMSQKTDMNINDPLVTAGLTVDEEHWKQITASYDGHLHGIRSKFGVDFNVSQSDDCKDKVDVKVRYRRPGGNASMESHAARALLRLWQKIQTSPIPLTHLQGASGFSGSPQNQRFGSKPEGSSTDPVFNGQLVAVKDKDEAAGDDEDEKCCICLDAFTDKRRLKCKHEFCSECLKKSEESVGPFCPVCKDVFGVIEGNQPDSLVTAGLTVDEEHWKQITASYDGHLHGIRSKFGVDFNVSQSDVCKDKVDVKVRYRRPGGNASMESHAARALLRLWQKIQTSPNTLTHLQGASGFSGSPQNRSHGSKPEGSSTDPVFNGQIVAVKDKDEAAGDDEDEKCCICMDAFKNKRQLKCKHEFCSECLKKSEESVGPFCPVCKDVFGVIEGNQPDGKMTWRKHSFFIMASRKEVSLITVTVKWLKLAGPSKKATTDLQFALQTWFNKNKTGTTCSVLSQLDDGNFMIKIEPASTWSEFQKLNGQTLTSKNKTVTITSINGRSPQQEPQTSEAASVNLHPSSTLQDDVEMNKVKQNVFSCAAADSAAEELTCVLPVSYFWYMSNVYKEQLQHIEEATGVKITAEEKVNFGSSGDQQKALSEFINLYQKSLREFSFKAVPIKDVHSEARSNAKEIIQKSDNKVQHFNNSVGKSTEPVFNGQLVAGKDKDEAAGDDEDEKCCICMDAFTDKRRLKCKHEFCSKCLKKSEESVGPFCPVCKDVFGVIEGNQPDGKMRWRKHPSSLPGFHDCGTIEIYYNIPSGKQTDKHPSPGQLYHGIYRTAYLPDNKEGNEVLHLLKRAFDQKLIFTVGSSRTTGMDNQVTWNDIHHKTSTSGGPQCFGYPDPNYLSRVKEELKAKGIK